jgi:hypothetical protein
MLPAVAACRPSALSSLPVSAVVVVFPFEPVIAMYDRRGRNRRPISTSLTMSTPAARAAAKGGASGGTPGLATMSDAPAMRSRSWRPTSVATPSSRRARAVASSIGDAETSDA